MTHPHTHACLALSKCDLLTQQLTHIQALVDELNVDETTRAWDHLCEVLSNVQDSLQDVVSDWPV